MTRTSVVGLELLAAFEEWGKEQAEKGETEPYISGDDRFDGWACLDANFDLNAIAKLFLDRVGSRAAEGEGAVILTG
jgi:hypothetical protein